MKRRIFASLACVMVLVSVIMIPISAANTDANDMAFEEAAKMDFSEVSEYPMYAFRIGERWYDIESPVFATCTNVIYLQCYGVRLEGVQSRFVTCQCGRGDYFDYPDGNEITAGGEYDSQSVLRPVPLMVSSTADTITIEYGHNGYDATPVGGDLKCSDVERYTNGNEDHFVNYWKITLTRTNGTYSANYVQKVNVCGHLYIYEGEVNSFEFYSIDSYHRLNDVALDWFRDRGVIEVASPRLKVIINNYIVGEFVAGQMYGEITGYKNGHEVGYKDGYDVGYEKGDHEGYFRGFGEGNSYAYQEQSSLSDMIWAVITAPVDLINGMLNFDVFGINVAGLAKALITISVLAVLITVIWKKIK